MNYNLTLLDVELATVIHVGCYGNYHLNWCDSVGNLDSCDGIYCRLDRIRSMGVFYLLGCWIAEAGSSLVGTTDNMLGRYIACSQLDR